MSATSNPSTTGNAGTAPQSTSVDACPKGSLCWELLDIHFPKQTEWVFIVIGVGGGLLLLGFIAFVVVAYCRGWHKLWFAPMSSIENGESMSNQPDADGAPRHRRHRRGSKLVKGRRHRKHRHTVANDSMPYGDVNEVKVIGSICDSTEPYQASMSNNSIVVVVPSSQPTPRTLQRRICLGIVESEVDQAAIQGTLGQVDESIGNRVPASCGSFLVRRPDGKKVLISKSQIKQALPPSPTELMYGRSVYVERDSMANAAALSRSSSATMTFENSSGKKKKGSKNEERPNEPDADQQQDESGSGVHFSDAIASSEPFPYVNYYDVLCDAAFAFEYTLGTAVTGSTIVEMGSMSDSESGSSDAYDSEEEDVVA